MMRAVMDKSMLRTLISRAGIIPMEDLNIAYTADGWRIRARDASNIALIEIIVWRNSMHSYECRPYDESREERPQCTSVSFRRFIEAVNVLPEDEVVTMTAYEVSVSKLATVDEGAVLDLEQEFEYYTSPVGQ